MKPTYLPLALVIIASLVVVGCGEKEAAPPPTPPVVLVTEATTEDIPIFTEAIATLDGSTNSQIHSQVSGYLIQQPYKEGTQVKQGDLLFQIDPKPFQADLDKANADLVNKQAQLKRSQDDLARFAALVKSGAVSQQEYQNQVQTVQSAQANVDAAQATVTTAQINLGYTKVTAPITGIAGKAMAQIGDLVSPSTQLTTISALDPIQADFSVTEQYYLDNAEKLAKVNAIPLADRPENIELLLADGTPYLKKGRFYYVNRQIQTSTGAIMVCALFPNPDNILRPGQYAKVRGVTQRINGAVVIPQRAVTELQGTNQVVVIKADNTAEIRNVTVGDRVGSMWIITSGLQSGERVVVEGIQKCQPGSPVTPQPFVPEKIDLPATNATPTPVTPPTS